MGDEGICTKLSKCVSPMGMPMIVEMTMLKKMAPLTFQVMRIPLTRIQMANNCFSGSVVKLARAMMSELASMMCAFFRPIEARKNPTPTAMALRSEMGMHSMMYCRMPEKESTVKSMPSRKMAVRAKCQE